MNSIYISNKHEVNVPDNKYSYKLTIHGLGYNSSISRYSMGKI